MNWVGEEAQLWWKEAVRQNSTIAAIATGSAPGGIGVVRLSGPAALEAGRRVAPGLPAEPRPRHAYFTALRDRAGRVLDEGLVLYFAAPASFTGEDVVELHAHGAPRLLALLLEEVLAHPGVRLAEAGEFTRRAYLNGRMDLARAEAVADLVAAESEAQVRAAAAQLSGELSRRLEEVRKPLLALHADLEGALDFPDETEGVELGVAERVVAARRAVEALVGDARAGALVRRGARVVLYGPVNAGKSTLFNRLVGAQRALVDEEPGTTRDALEARLEIGGLVVTLVDTAGLRSAPGRLEAMGIERTREALRGADLALLVVPPEATPEELEGWRAEVAEEVRVELWGKADLRSGGASKHPSGGVSKHLASDGGVSKHPPPTAPPAPLRVSGQTGEGLDALRALLVERLEGVAGAVQVTSERHLDALRRATDALERAETASRVSTLEVVSGEVGLALAALADITGEDASAELLDAIFARFCIGK
jgi:tRNA modification GTPase